MYKNEKNSDKSNKPYEISPKTIQKRQKQQVKILTRPKKIAY